MALTKDVSDSELWHAGDLRTVHGLSLEGADSLPTAANGPFAPDDPATTDERWRTAEQAIFDSAIRGDEYGDVLLSLLERSGVGLAILDPSLRVHAVNNAFTAQCGKNQGDICDRSIAEFLHPSVCQHLMRQFGRLVQGQHTRLIGRSTAMWFRDNNTAGSLTVYPVEDENGNVKTILVLFSPEKAETDAQTLVGSQWRLTALTAKVLEGAAAGDSTVRLAAKLFLSRQGIEYHVSILLRQFKVPNRTALVAKAYSIGVFGIGSWPPKVLPDYIRADRQGAERVRVNVLMDRCDGNWA